MNDLGPGTSRVVLPFSLAVGQKITLKVFEVWVWFSDTLRDRLEMDNEKCGLYIW